MFRAKVEIGLVGGVKRLQLRAEATLSKPKLNHKTKEVEVQIILILKTIHKIIVKFYVK